VLTQVQVTVAVSQMICAVSRQLHELAGYVTRVSEHVHRSDWRREHRATHRMARVHAAL